VSCVRWMGSMDECDGLSKALFWVGSRFRNDFSPICGAVKLSRAWNDVQAAASIGGILSEFGGFHWWDW
jgi:hypothetical protein